MKIAVLGHSATGAKIAKHFHELGAHVLQLGEESPHTLERRLDGLLSTIELAPVYGTRLPQGNPSHFQQRSLLRVQKRFLGRNEEIEQRIRLADMFRLVYVAQGWDGSQAMPEGMKLPEDVLQNLSEPLEGFKDFDIVIDARIGQEAPSRLGPGGQPAINEKLIRSTSPESFYDGLPTADQLEKIKGSKRIVLVGDDALAGLWTVLLHDWLKESQSHQLTIVTSADQPYHAFKKDKGLDGLRNKLDEVFLAQQQKWGEQKAEYTRKWNEWNELEPYMKAKIHPPTEPVSGVQFFCRSRVTSVDKLIDQTGIFITMETPEWQDQGAILKTIGADAVISCNGHEYCQRLFTGMRRPDIFRWMNGAVERTHGEEPGLYRIEEDLFHPFQEELLLSEIERAILGYFSRNE